MGAAGQRLGLRLFLEGLEVPVVAANVSIGVNAPAAASIQVVPGDRLLELKPRTMVHLFFWDYTLDNEPLIDIQDPEIVAQHYGVTVDDAKKIIADNPQSLSDIDEMRGYKLLYSGEVVGVTMLKTPAGRQAVLQCSDFSTYWDTTYQFFISYSPNGNFLGTEDAVWAGGASMFDDLTAGHVSVMNEYLNDTPKTPGLENVKGLMGGIISLLEAMGGVPEHTHGVNDFFTIAELKNHILQQIVAEENDDTAQRLFDDKAFEDWLNRGMSSLGELCTFRDMMKLLFQYVYYEVVPNPAAMYVRGKKSQTAIKNVTVTNTAATTELFPSVAQAEIQALIFNAQANSDLVYISDDPRLMAPDDEDARALEFSNQLKGIEFLNTLPARTKQLIEQAILVLTDVKSLAGIERFTVRQTPNGITTQIPREEPKQFRTNRKAWKQVVDLLTRSLNGNIVTTTSTKKVSTQTQPELDQLHTQIFRPDCFFAAPPKCNVIFPEQYTQFQFSRNFLQEVTRLRLHEEWEFGINEGLLETNVHFAPSSPQIQALAQKQGNDSVRALLPWEIYSGILPKFETVHEVNYVAGQAERKLGISSGSIKGQARDYTQRVANFNYMKYRFAARTAEISAKFNPFLVCGFPGLVIERPFIIDPNDPSNIDKLNKALAKVNSGRETTINLDDVSDHIRDIARAYGAPSQYLGMIAALTHNVDQNGGATSVVMTHARTHRVTEDDFLNIFSEEIVSNVTTESVSTILDAEDVIKKGDWKSIKLIIDATDQSMGDNLKQLLSSDQDVASPENGTDLLDRPDGTPDLSAVPQLSSFAPLLNLPPASANDATIQNFDGDVTLRGKVKKSRLSNTRQAILEPDPYGKLKVGSKGPQGGKITAIQVFSDAAIMVSGIDTTKNTIVANPTITGAGPVDSFTSKTKDGKNNVFMWRKIAIYEDRPLATPPTVSIPVEEAIRPPWFSPLYSNWFIGQEIYGKFLGTGSIVDEALFVAPNGAATFGTGRAQQQQILDQLKDADGDQQKIIQILQNAKAQNIADVPDVESSADVLAYIYGEVRRLGLDVHRFVHDYTRRPIATMEEILGSRDLQYQVSGNQLQLVSGIPGFHSTAVGDFGGQLLGLLDNPDLGLARLRSGGKKSPVSRDLDPRPGRREQVVAYLEEINASSGSLGVGVEG